jgi:hypothetical protein
MRRHEHRHVNICKSKVGHEAWIRRSRAPHSLIILLQKDTDFEMVQTFRVYGEEGTREWVVSQDQDGRVIGESSGSIKVNRETQ